MNRDQYIQMRKTGQYDFGLLYQYYIEKRNNDKALIPFQVFQQTFNMYFQMNGGVIVESLDRDFMVQKIENEQGNLIYIN